MTSINRKESYYLRPKINGTTSNVLKKNYDEILKKILIKNEKEVTEEKNSEERSVNNKNNLIPSHINQTDRYKANQSINNLNKINSAKVPKPTNKNFTNISNKTKLPLTEKKENYSSVNHLKSKIREPKSPNYSNKTITVDLSSKKSSTNIISGKELKMKNYFYKPKFVNLNLSPDAEESEKYFTNANVQTDFYLETEISSTNNSKQSSDLKKEYFSLSKDLSNIKIDGLNHEKIKQKKIDLKTARSLSKNRKYSISSGESNKAEKNVQEDYSSANYSLNENYNQEKINNSLCGIVNNLEKFGRSVSPKHNLEKMTNSDNPNISSRVITNINDEKNININGRMLNVLRLKNKLKTNKLEIEK